MKPYLKFPALVTFFASLLLGTAFIQPQSISAQNIDGAIAPSSPTNLIA